MKNFKRLFSSAVCLLLCSVILLLAGCNEQRVAEQPYELPGELDKLQTTCVAENERYSLIWNAEKSCVILFDKVTEYEWSYVPEDSMNDSYDYSVEGAGDSANVHPRIKSPVLVQYFMTSNFQEDETNAFAMSISKDNFTVSAVENGLEMMLYFDDRGFAVPVRFTLNDKGVDVSVDPTKIQENEIYNVYGITLAPFFCSVSNKNASKDDYYLFTPSGSGAIINPVVDNTKDAPVVLSDYVYGQDANVTMFENKANAETIRMPMYGAVNGDKGVCAIIKSGAENAKITTTIAHKLTGYSHVTADFTIRGCQEVVQNLFTATTVKAKLYADAFTPENITVGYYPLYGEDASYVGMAETYRDYLTETGYLKNEKSNDSLLNLKLFGGIETKEFHFGIPSDAMLVATTLDQAYNIIKDVKDRTGLNNINANLIGFGQSGNDIGTVAGNYEIGGDFGDEDDLKKIIKYANANGVNLFMNFDMVRFSKSGGGVSTAFGKADAANGSYTTLNYYSLSLRTKEPTLRSYYLVARTKLSEVATNIKDVAAEWKLPGISLDSLTSISYSDYSEEKYYSRAFFDDQVKGIMSKYNADGYKLAGSDANAFAAAFCSHVYDVPMQSSKHRSYSYDVPAYQIVFKGLVSMSGSSANLSTDDRVNFLKAVESGSGLTYSLIGEYDTNLITSAQNVFYGSVYWDNTIERGARENIEAAVKEYKDLFNKVNGAKIVDHKIINEDVRMTVYDNGTTVYVNYGTEEFVDGDVTVAAQNFTVKGA